MTITIDTTELQDKLDLIRSLVSEDAIYRDIIYEAGYQTAVYLETLLDEYPPQSNKPLPLIHEWTSSAGNTISNSPFKSQKQQGYFFAAMAEGTLTVPYVRTGGLGASMTSQVEWQGDILVLSVGSNLEYAPLVIGDDDEQADYHKGTWPQLGALVQQHENEIVIVFGQALDRQLKRLIG